MVADDPIKHVVVLMLENRSFDQILGGLKAVYPPLEGVDPNNPRSNPDLAASPPIFQAETQVRQARREIDQVIADLKKKADSPTPTTGDIGAMRATLGGLGLGDIQLQQFGGPDEVLIRVAEQPGGDAAQQEAVQKVRGALGDAVDYRRVEVVGPRVSGELLAYGMLGLMLAIFSILIYLWFRFEWQFALGAMIANVHDIVLTIGFMSISQVDFDLTSIAALLTILGYSLNDTVVIYDRIREMLRRYKKMPMPELLNESINSTLSRSIITHVTVTLALLALLLFGGHAIHSFTAVMMFGVVLVGTYTSIFIAAPILIYLGVGTHRADPDQPVKPSRP